MQHFILRPWMMIEYARQIRCCRWQVLNLVPWGGVEVDLRHLRFAGLQGWDALARAVVQSYIQDITANQVCGACPVTRARAHLALQISFFTPLLCPGDTD